ncbi:hypothetical protein FRC12_020067 [Ceratobasidium sp. 428]|nr:hypothetical protein FRC12_020067 [Ceratobasidium sp. 428]
MKRFWELVPLAKLTRAFLTIQVARDGDEGEDNFVPLLCQASPRIRSLRLTFSDRADFNEEDRNIHKISAETFEYLSRLPLDEYLFLGSTRFDFDNAWAMIARTWPALCDIRCLHQPTSLAEFLHLSAALPKLFQIECDLGLEQAIRTVRPNWEPVSGSQYFPNIHTLTIKDSELREHASSYEYNLSDLARFFAYFWPNMRIQSTSAYSRRDYEDETWKYNQALFHMFQKLVDAHVKSFYH